MLDLVLHFAIMLVAVVSKYFYNTSQLFVDYSHSGQYVAFLVLNAKHFVPVSKAEVIICIIQQ